MKKIVNTVSAVFLIGLAFVADAHEAKIVLYPTIGPVSIPSFGIVSPSFDAFAANVLNGLQRERRDFGGNILGTPRAFKTIGLPISNRSGRVKIR